MDKNFLTLGMVVAALVSLGMGMYEMFVYEPVDNYPFEAVNAAVGNDADNVIINSAQSTAWMVLFAAFLIGAFLTEILFAIKNQQQAVSDNRTRAVVESFENPLEKKTQEENPVHVKLMQDKADREAAKIESYKHVKGEGFGTWLKKELF